MGPRTRIAHQSRHGPPDGGTNNVPQMTPFRFRRRKRPADDDDCQIIENNASSDKRVLRPPNVLPKSRGLDEDPQFKNFKFSIGVRTLTFNGRPQNGGTFPDKREIERVKTMVLRKERMEKRNEERMAKRQAMYSDIRWMEEQARKENKQRSKELRRKNGAILKFFAEEKEDGELSSDQILNLDADDIKSAKKKAKQIAKRRAKKRKREEAEAYRLKKMEGLRSGIARAPYDVRTPADAQPSGSAKNREAADVQVVPIGSVDVETNKPKTEAMALDQVKVEAPPRFDQKSRVPDATLSTAEFPFVL